MQLSPSLARRFIDSYKAFLSTLPPEAERAGDVLQVLLKGRRRYAADRSLLDGFCRQAPRKGAPAHDAEMLDAIAAARIGRWIYLKDTRSYSVLLDEQGDQAFAVLGLTQRLRELYDGSSGLVFEAALVPLAGHWVCDGLIADPLALGPELRRSLTARYQLLRAEGRFSAGPGPLG